MFPTLRSFFIVFFLGIFIAGYAQADEPEMTFYASYDTAFSADQAKGGRAADFSLGEVNFETLEAYLQPGIKGKALYCGIMGKDDDAARVRCIYKTKRNMNSRKGGLSFWVKPVDWTPADKRFHIFFSAMTADDLMLVYQFIDSQDLFFLYGPRAKDADGKYQWTVAMTSMKDWAPDQWHMVACNWDSKQLQLFVDGELRKELPLAKPLAGHFEEFSVGEIVGGRWKGTEGSSLIDEFKIYDQPRAAEDITSEYQDLAQKEQTQAMMRIAPRTPVMDGVINDNEYSFRGAGFFDVSDGLSQTPGTYAVAYDNQWLYVAVQTPVFGDGLIASQKTRDGKIYTDDSVEVYLSPFDSKEYCQIVVNSAGAVFDAQNGDASWNLGRDIVASSQVENGRWTMELAIPIGPDGVAIPVASSPWRLNVCRTYADPRQYLSAAPVEHAYKDVPRFIRVFPDSHAPTLAISRIGDLGKGDLDLAISSGSPVSADVELLVNDKKELGKQYAVSSDGLDVQQAFSVDRNQSGGSHGVLTLSVTQPGDFKPIYRSAFPFGSTPVFEFQYAWTDLHTHIAKAVVNYQGSMQNEEPLVIKLVDSATGDIAASHSMTPEKRFFTMDLPITGVAPGDYRLVVEQGSFQQGVDYQVPQNPAVWDDNKFGKLTKVPDPWTDVQVDGDRISFWGRTVDMTDNVFPAQITSQGEQMLAAPIRLAMNGKPIVYEKVENKVDLPNGIHADVKAAAESGDLLVSTQTRVEYDGFMWIRLSIEAKRPIDIQSLAVEIPMRGEQASLVHELSKGYEHIRTNSGRIPDSGWRKNLFQKPIFWVGNEDAGLQWFAENLKGWSVRDENNSATARRDPATGDMLVSLNLVDHPIKLEGRRTIEFGLMPTPVRPLPEHWRAFRGGKNAIVWFPYTKLFNYPGRDQVIDNAYVQQVMSSNTTKPVTYYHSFYMTTPLSPQWPYWAQLWHLDPPALGQYKDSITNRQWVSTHVSAASSSYRDFYLWQMNEALETHGIKDLYFDHGVPRMDKNTEHGSGWIDDSGRLRESYNILGTRELARRIYILLHQHSPNGIIVNHMSEEPAMPVLAYADYMVDGELYCRQVAEDRSYYNVFRPDLFRAQFMSRQWGPVSVFIPQFERGSQAFDKDSVDFWKTPEAQKPLNNYIGYILAHDAKTWPIFGVNMDPVYAAQDAFGWDEPMRFVGYWDQSSPFHLEGQPANASDSRRMVSGYIKPDSIMLILFNDTDKDQTFAVDVDMKQAGVSKGLTQATNALTQEPVSWSGDRLTELVPAREFRMVVLK